MSSTTLTASRGNLVANSTVPIGSMVTPGGYDDKGMGGRQSYSTNQLSGSVSGSIGVSGSLGGAFGTGGSGTGAGSGVGASGFAGQGASYGPGRGLVQSGTYYE